jgi:hypothetical protein
MTPEDLAQRHPRLYHLTSPGAVESIRRHGLLPPLSLLDLFGADPGTRTRALARRPEAVVLTHPVHGRAVVTDNRPLSDVALARILDDGLSPDDWRWRLAERVFFWVDGRDLAKLRGARLNRDRARVVIEFDTLSLARAHADKLEISPINSGATIHDPPRRGNGTYAPLLCTDWQEWRRRRGRVAPDRVKEVTIRGPVLDAGAHIVRIVSNDDG